MLLTINKMIKYKIFKRYKLKIIRTICVIKCQLMNIVSNLIISH